MSPIDETNFSDLESLRVFLAENLAYQVQSLKDYHVAASDGFYHRYDDRIKQDYSKSSTATCILSLNATGRWSDGPWFDKTEALAADMLRREWKSAGLRKNNAFTVAFILEAVTVLLENLPDDRRSAFLQDSANFDLLRRAEDILLRSVRRGQVRLEEYPPSAYLTQLVVRVLQRRDRLTPDIAARVEDWAWHEMDHQLALLLSESKTADIFQLAYSVILTSAIGEPAEVQPDRSLIRQTAIAQLFKAQLPDGSWPRSRPLFHYPRVGSAYCYEYEMLVQLVTQVALWERLLEFMPGLAKAAYAIRETAFELDGGGRGWSSGHHPQIAGPESWSTASVYHYLHVLGRLVAEAVRRTVFTYLDAPYTPPRRPKADGSAFAPDFLDCPLKIDQPSTSLRSALFEGFVDRVAVEADRIEKGGSLSKSTPMSAIFFGPPGTSKTELTDQIAKYLQWPLLPVDPSHFVRNGLDKVQAEADVIFSMLAAAERIVVLLDEFDEMVRDRHSASELVSRFLTTAMLPKLAKINKERKIVFIVATNNIDQFDLAISRAGRFDVLLQVLPPKAEEKLRFWSNSTSNLTDLSLNVNQDSDRLDKISMLTYDEYKSLASELESAPSANEALQMIDSKFRACTLSSPFADGKTWREACIEQASKMRLPPQVR